ncbi:MAG: hypothetical protein R2780_06565 [Crocinitomicaceae bacterium]|nr:hypothetical protein [Crocinitomicaceae bacterium]
MLARLSLLVLFLISFSVYAQFNFDVDKILEKLISPIQSDRPGQAFNPTTCGIAAIQIQSGFSYSRYNSGIDSNWKNYYIPTTIRLGFTRKWEFNSSFYYNYNNWSTFAGPVKSSGFQSPEIGIRYAFMKGDGWKPFMALQSNLSFLSHRGDYQQQQFGSSFLLSTSNRFNVLSINTNIGIKFLGTGNMNPVIPYVVNFGFNLGEKWSMFAEGFGQFSTSGIAPTINTDAGLAFTPTKLIQLDLFGGWLGGFSSGATEHWFVELGVSYKISLMKYFAKKKIEEFKKGNFGNFGGFNFGG